MATCQAPPQLPFLTLVNDGSSACPADHPLYALRLRMESGDHKYAAPGSRSTPGDPPVEQRLQTLGGEAQGSFVTPQPAHYPTALSPPPTPGRLHGRSRNKVDVSNSKDYPAFLPSTRLARKNPTKTSRIQMPIRVSPNESRAPYRPEPRFDSPWVSKVDIELGNAESSMSPSQGVPNIPFAPFLEDATPPVAALKPEPPYAMSGRNSPETMTRKMGGMSLGSQAAVGEAKFRKRAGKTGINARCA